MELHETLTLLRKERGLSQAAVAEKLNISRQSISKWESGIAVPTTDNLLAISKLYQVSIDELLGCQNTQTLPAGEPSPASINRQHASNRKVILLIAALAALTLVIGCFLGAYLAERQHSAAISTKDTHVTALDPEQGDEFDLEW